MNKRKTEIPVFATYEEAAGFFDTHDVTGLDVENVGWQVFFSEAPGSRPKRSGRGVVNVPVEVRAPHLTRIRAVARRQGKTPREWLRRAIETALAGAER